jgi:hypothetical protein
MTRKPKAKPPRGRPRIGQPISITLTEEQRDWIDAQITPGGTRTEVFRRIIAAAMKGEKFRP